MSVQLAPSMMFQAFGPNGQFLVGGQLFTYAAGTSTPQATYVDSTQTTQNTNPVILNAMGQASVWLDVTLSYKFVLQDSAGNPISSQDNISGALFSKSLTLGPPASGPTLTLTNVAGGDAIDVNYTQSGGSAVMNAIGSTNAFLTGIEVKNSLAGSAGGCEALLCGNDTTNFFIFGKQSTGNSGFFTGGSAGDLCFLQSGGGPPIVIVVGATVRLTINSTGIAVNGTFSSSGAAATGPLTVTGAAGISGNETVGGTLTVTGAAGINGATAQTPNTGWGTPTGPAVVNNYSGTAATLVQTSNAVAEIITVLKAFGLLGV